MPRALFEAIVALPVSASRAEGKALFQGKPDPFRIEAF